MPPDRPLFLSASAAAGARGSMKEVAGDE